MVKFSKQLEGQLVPEWRSAYCNYWQLKKNLREIKQFLRRKQGGAEAANLLASRSSESPMRTFSGLTSRRKNVQNDVIQVHVRTLADPQEYVYETELLEPVGNVEEEKSFFARLDEQLNSVNKFYKGKEAEYCKRGEALSRQMEMLIETKRAISILAGSSLSSRRSTEVEAVESLEDSQTELKSFPLSSATMLASLSQALINQSKSNVLHETDLQVTRKKVQCADKMLRMAFSEFYRGLGLLKSYSSLNVVAFAKIMKKYDKITGRRVSPIYLSAVEGSYFNRSDKVTKLMDKVERVYTEHFANHDRKRAMACLRPMQQKASHTVTFFLGLFTGAFIALFAAFLIVSRLDGHYTSAVGSSSPASTKYMESIFPTFSMLALVLIHIYMYGWNVYAWRRTRINYAFIFEFQPGKELRHREILLVSTGLTMILAGGMVAHLAAHFKAKSSSTVDLVPAVTVLVFVGLLICPLDFFYRSSRLFFLRCLRNVVCSPLHKVVLADFFLADQLTSQVAMFRNLEFVVCYYGWGHFKTRNVHACTKSGTARDVMYIVSLVPYWWRLMQCFRRWIDEGDKAHIANGGKYLSAMMAVAMRLSYMKNGTIAWMVMFILSSTLATVYQLYWDLVVDWGLLQPYSMNPWLRDWLILRHKSFYFISMIVNVLLRCAWLQSITSFHFENLDRHVMDFIFAALEVFRRGLWNFYRIENEHLNNVGHYRAVKCVPLPFRDTQDIEV